MSPTPVLLNVDADVDGTSAIVFAFPVLHLGVSALETLYLREEVG